MPLPIQRVPQGLGQLLSTFGGQSPQQLSENVSGVLDLMQFYGLQQRSFLQATDAALALGGFVTVGPLSVWSVCFGVLAVANKAAAMTDLSLAIYVRDNVYAYNQATNLGAASGQFYAVYAPDTPLLIPPGNTFRAFLASLAGVATANVTVRADIGLLG